MTPSSLACSARILTTNSPRPESRCRERYLRLGLGAWVGDFGQQGRRLAADWVGLSIEDQREVTAARQEWVLTAPCESGCWL